MPAKAKSKGVEARQVPATTEAAFTYVDANGIEQTLDLFKVKNLGETEWAESQKLFPNATQCMVDKAGVKFDSDGRQNLLNENLVVVSAVRMTTGQFGPWFMLQGIHPELGEITVPAPGMVANGAMEQIAGINLSDGESRGTASELPVWVRFEFVPEKGKFGEGYFVILPAEEQVEALAE